MSSRGDPVKNFPDDLPTFILDIIKRSQPKVLPGKPARTLFRFDGHVTWAHLARVRVWLDSLDSCAKTSGVYMYAPHRGFSLTALLGTSENRLQMRVTAQHR